MLRRELDQVCRRGGPGGAPGAWPAPGRAAVTPAGGPDTRPIPPAAGRPARSAVGGLAIPTVGPPTAPKVGAAAIPTIGPPMVAAGSADVPAGVRGRYRPGQLSESCPLAAGFGPASGRRRW